MKQRTLLIIQNLCELGRKISISDLAKQFKVSERTIRNDLNRINDVLIQFDLSELKINKGGDIERSDTYTNILSFVSENDFYNYKLSKEERIKIASILLIDAVEFITLSTISEHLFVSRATVINDLKDIKKIWQQIT